jgi:hypothetical protein
MNSGNKISVIAAFSVVAALSVGGCAGGGHSEDGSRDAAYLMGNLQAQTESMAVRQLGRSLTEYLPNQRFDVDGASVQSLSEVVVKGRVEYARGVAGFYYPDGENSDESSSTQIPFDDKRALWRTIEVGVRVEDKVGVLDDDVARFALTVDGPDHERLVEEAGNLGDVVVFLTGSGTVKADKGLRRVAGFGALLGRVGDDGKLTFDLADSVDDAGAGIDVDHSQWDDLKQAGAQKRATISTDRLGNRT